MKHPFIVYLILCLWCWAPLATLRAVPLHFLVGANTQAEDTSPTYLIFQNFESTGYDNGETWTETGVWYPDYTTTVLLGSQSLMANTSNPSNYTTFSAQSTAHAFCMFRLSALPSAVNSVFGLRSGTTLVTGFRVNSGGSITLYANSADSSASSVSLAINTTYYVWLTHVSGGTCVLAMSTTTTKPSADGSGNVYLTRTGAASNVDRIDVRKGTDAGTFIWDRIIVDDVAIGNNP